MSRKSGVLVKSSELEQNLEVLASLPSPPLAIFQLLVAVSGIVQPEHYTELGPVIWNNYLDSADENSLGPVSGNPPIQISYSPRLGRLSSHAKCRKGCVRICRTSGWSRFERVSKATL